MPLTLLIPAILLMLALGAVAAVLFRLGGLVVLLGTLAALLLLRGGLGLPLPGWGTTLLLFAALQAGYLGGALSPLADLVRRSPPVPDRPHDGTQDATQDRPE